MTQVMEKQSEENYLRLQRQEHSLLMKGELLQTRNPILANFSQSMTSGPRV